MDWCQVFTSSSLFALPWSGFPILLVGLLSLAMPF
jgi:hypothetical protein